MSRRMRRGRWLIVIAVLVAACSDAAPSAESTGPRDVPAPQILPADAARVRAEKLARFIEARWPRVLVFSAEASPLGEVVAFGLRAEYDTAIQPREAYYEHLRRLSGDLRQASVELLKVSVEHFPRLRYASAWDERVLQAFWSRERILAMGDPASFRDHRAWQRLVVTAEIPPFALQLQRAHASSLTPQQPLEPPLPARPARVVPA
jgi:hypothetical protein